MNQPKPKNIEGRVLSVDINYLSMFDDDFCDMKQFLVETKEGIKSIEFYIEDNGSDDLIILCLNRMFKGNYIVYELNSFKSNEGGITFEHNLRIISGPYRGIEYKFYH
jgi:hypothetical protein